MSATVAPNNRAARTRTVRLGRHSRHSSDKMDCRHIFDTLHYGFHSKKGEKLQSIYTEEVPKCGKTKEWGKQ